MFKYKFKSQLLRSRCSEFTAPAQIDYLLILLSCREASSSNESVVLFSAEAGISAAIFDGRCERAESSSVLKYRKRTLWTLTRYPAMPQTIPSMHARRNLLLGLPPEFHRSLNSSILARDFECRDISYRLFILPPLIPFDDDSVDFISTISGVFFVLNCLWCFLLYLNLHFVLIQYHYSLPEFVNSLSCYGNFISYSALREVSCSLAKTTNDELSVYFLELKA